MKIKLLTLAMLFAVSGPAAAHNIEVGKALPSFTVEDGGIATVQGEEVEFMPWSTSVLPQSGTTVIIANAARPVANKMTPVAFIEKIEKTAGVKVFKIVNADDAAFGAGMFINGAIRNGKLEKPEVESVVVQDGELFLEWDAEEESSIFMVLKNGKVAYVHEGTVGEAQQQKILAAIN